ncbi:RhoGAP domain-containing protein [Aphelenchoides avenae]|nr:RhoGAP domain-containing protein [Aphelenchus avenae]
MTDWTITGMRKCAQPRVYSSASHSGTPSAAAATLTDVSLDSIAAYDVDMDVGDRKNSTRITLHRVPSFLVEAFAVLDTNKAWTTEGVFRKEGNSTRMRNAHRIYCGLASIPKECTTHDVCSLIKRFFRELKPSIFIDKQRNILKFAETLRDRALLQAILTIFDTLPPSHKATLAFLMRQLQKASESSAANQMTIDNLAVVFAPTLFRDDPAPPTPASRKKRGSQDSLLNTVLTLNELRASVVKLFITNAHLLGTFSNTVLQVTRVLAGVPSAAEHPTRHVVRKPSDLKRKQVAPAGLHPADKKVSPRSASESAPRRPTTEQADSSAKEPLGATKSSDAKYAAKRHGKKDKDFQKNRKRSSSVARIFSVISNLYSKPSGGESRPTTPTPHSSKDRPESPQMDFHDDDAHHEQSGPSRAFLKTPERLSRVHSPRRANVNGTPSDARCKRVPTARTPITTVFGVEQKGGTRPERTMSLKAPARPAHTVASRMPSSAAQKPQIAVPKPADNACSLGEEYIKKASTTQLRAIALQIDRQRRHTAPVKQSGIKRNQPNTLKSGLVEPRGTIYDDHSAAAAPQSPKTCEQWTPCATTQPPRPSAAPQQHSPKATIKLPDAPTTPKRPLGPVSSSPLPCSNGSPSGFSASNERLREIVSAKTSKELEEKTQLPACARPSIALFQRQNRGFVQQRVHQFASLLETGLHDQSTRSSMAAYGTHNTDESDAAAAKPSGAAPRVVQSRMTTFSSFKRSTGTSALHGRSPAARTGFAPAAPASSTSSSRSVLASSTSAGVLPPRREPSPPRNNVVMFGRRNVVSAVDIRHQRQRTSASESDRH